MVFTLCVLSTGAFAGPLDKAFAALEVHNYFKAKELFEKQTKRHPAAAWYGLSVIAEGRTIPFISLIRAMRPFSVRWPHIAP